MTETPTIDLNSDWAKEVVRDWQPDDVRENLCRRGWELEDGVWQAPAGSGMNRVFRDQLVEDAPRWVARFFLGAEVDNVYKDE